MRGHAGWAFHERRRRRDRKPGREGLKNLAAVAVNLHRPNEVYAASADGIIFKSTDGGATWERQKR